MFIDQKNKLILPKGFKVAGSSLFSYLSNNVVNGDHSYQILFNDHKSFHQIIQEYGLNSSDYAHVRLIRNPWDYVVSAFEWAKHNNECPDEYTFDDFLRDGSDFKWRKQINFWSNFNESDVFIIFEDIPLSLYSFFGLINHNFDETVFPHKKKIKRLHYSKYYTDGEQVDIVRDHFSELLSIHKYKFI